MLIPGNSVTDGSVLLGPGQEWSGTWIESASVGSRIGFSVLADQPGTLHLDLSNNRGRTTPSVITIPVLAGQHKFRILQLLDRSFRVRYVNGDVGQGEFELATYVGEYGTPSAPLNARIAQDSDAITVRTDGVDAVMRGKVAGEYILPRFGRNPDVDGEEDIWNGGGDYTGFPTTAAEELQVFSSSANDTAEGTGARQIRIFYHDADNNKFDAAGNFLSATVTPSGTTAVNTGITAYRVWYAEVIESGSGRTNAGDMISRSAGARRRASSSLFSRPASAQPSFRTTRSRPATPAT